MGKKANEGFTKNAQKQKFVRNRDITLKGSEIKKEQKTQKLMAEGICQRCRDKVQWRFRYDKYKALKNPATCQNCKQKLINKAYRAFCDKCASTKNACAGCCGDMKELNAIYENEQNEKKKNSIDKGDIEADDEQAED